MKEGDRKVQKEGGVDLVHICAETESQITGPMESIFIAPLNFKLLVLVKQPKRL